MAGDEGTISYKAPGYAADLFFSVQTGDYRLIVEQQGFVGVMNDLHKGRDAPGSWKWIIDISALLLVVAAGRALTTTSRAGSSCWRSRNDSRARRLMRLRFTALPAALMPTASPSRARPASFGRVSTRNSASEDR